jgi:hypothetical protein
MHFKKKIITMITITTKMILTLTFLKRRSCHDDVRPSNSRYPTIITTPIALVFLSGFLDADDVTLPVRRNSAHPETRTRRAVVRVDRSWVRSHQSGLLLLEHEVDPSGADVEFPLLPPEDDRNGRSCGQHPEQALVPPRIVIDDATDSRRCGSVYRRQPVRFGS